MQNLQNVLAFKISNFNQNHSFRQKQRYVFLLLIPNRFKTTTVDFGKSKKDLSDKKLSTRRSKKLYGVNPVEPTAIAEAYSKGDGKRTPELTKQTQSIY